MKNSAGALSTPGELRSRLFPVPGLAEEAGIEDFASGFRGGGIPDIEHSPIVEFGVRGGLPGVGA